ncbi:hypothetical protein F5884DRAFT_59305 [Xylogone sp. PMI_703]|nr:hypothetical protein F5884DRAFT_59305 [Xylogone sp. PMI_703]
MNALPEPMIPEMPGLSPGHHAQAPGHFHDVSQYCASDHSSFSKERDTLAEVATTPSLLNLAADYEHLKQSDHVELRTSQPGGRMSPLHVIQLLIRDFDVKSCNEKEEAAAQKLLAADVPLDNIDLDRMTCKRLCDEYFQKVNYWLPILSQERWMKEFEKAQSTNFQGNTMSEAVIFLTLALGAASTVDDPVNVAGQICGRKYFLRGLSTLGRNGIFTANLQTIQCKFFVSLYCLFALQPRPAAVAISEAAHLCEYLREYPSRRVLEGEDRDYHLRAFWCCAMLEGEIKVHLRGRRSGISQSLNLNRDWPQLAVDRQSLFFLAESQIRQMKQDIDCDLRAGPEFIFKPLLMKEHFNQLDQWYKILPEELMFNAEKAQDLFDDRKAFLRMQYHCARTSIATSAIFGSKDSERGFGSVTEETLFQHDQERNMYAQRYVNSAIQVLLGAPEQLFRRTIMTYLICEASRYKASHCHASPNSP